MLFLPEGAVRNPEAQDHIKGLEFSRFLRALHCSPCASDDHLAGRDRHPGVGTPAGRTPQRAPAVRPPDVSPEARVRRTPLDTSGGGLDRSRPIAPAEQPARLDALEAAVRSRTDMMPAIGV